jgi:hypothetical protein
LGVGTDSDRAGGGVGVDALAVGAFQRGRDWAALDVVALGRVGDARAVRAESEVAADGVVVLSAVRLVGDAGSGGAF